MHWSRDINIFRYDILANELGIIDEKIKLATEKIKEINDINLLNNLNYGLSEAALKNAPHKARNIGLTYIDSSADLTGMIADMLADPDKRKTLTSLKHIIFTFPGNNKIEEVKKFYNDCRKMFELLLEEYNSYLNGCKQIRNSLEIELDYYEQKIINPDHPEEVSIDKNFYDKFFARTSVNQKTTDQIGNQTEVKEAIPEDLASLQQEFAKYENPEDIPEKILDSIIYRDQSNLKKTSGGILKELCEHFAKEVYNLKEGKPLKKIYEKVICAQIIFKGYKTTPGSVGSTLRKELGFKKN